MTSTSWTLCVALASTAAAAAGLEVLSGVIVKVRSPAPNVVAFEHVTVVPMDGERLLRDYTVVVRDRRIVGMGPANRTPVPSDARRVDGRGRYLMPGLVDMHVHPYDPDQFINYLAHGVTTIGVLNGSPPVLRWRDEVSRGTRLGPTIYSAGPSLDGAPAGNPTFLSVATPEQGRRAVQQIADRGFDFVKVYSSLTRETYGAIVTEARARRIPVVGHIPESVGVDSALGPGGQDVVAHAEEFFRERVDSARREARLLDVVRRAKQAGIAIILTLSGYADYIRSIDDLQGVLSDPEMRYASPAAYSEKIPTHNRSVRPNPEQFRADVERGLARFRVFTKRLSDAGVALMLGTDTEIFGFAGASLHEELRQMVAAGLTPYQALVAGTSGPGGWIARHVRRAERFGRVAVGERADLLLLAANPLDDVNNTDRIDGVMVAGRWLPSDRLRTLRDSIARQYRPLRARVPRFDSLVAAGRMAEASTVLADLRRLDPGRMPIAQVVMWVNARRLLSTDTLAAIRALEWNAAMFPESHGAHTELARVLLAHRDTTRAIAAARRALELFPMHAPAEGIARLRR
jgi:imidazolonepropionase-like amidohydrolase